MYIDWVSQKGQLFLLKSAYKTGHKLGIRDKQITKKLLNQKVQTISVDLADEIANKIASGESFLLARLGGTEGQITGQYCEIKNGLLSDYNPETVRWMYTTSGFFVEETADKKEALDKYSRLTLDGLPECDYLSAMFPAKIYMPFFFSNYAKKATPTFSDFGPTFDKETSSTWYRGLKGKKVLVVNSFSESIKMQYGRKTTLVHDSAHELPDFNLITYRTAVTQVGERYGDYKNFFEVLEKMRKDIEQLEFDVALVGAGAYGFPLSVAIKRMGKIAIETCGTTPLFFGIYDERFLRQNGRPNYMTDNWIRPMEKPPERYKEIEGGCYW